MDLTILLSSIGVSTIVSGLVTFTLKSFIKTSIQNRYNQEIENLKHKHSIEIENLKAQLAVKTNSAAEITERRMTAYPMIVSLVYRIRNMCRDISGHLFHGNLSLVDELLSRTKDIEESLYMYRIDLQRDKQFDNVHKYKNLVINFGIRASDAKYFIEKKEVQRADNAIKELETMYNEIDNLHSPIIDSFSSFTNGKE